MVHVLNIKQCTVRGLLNYLTLHTITQTKAAHDHVLTELLQMIEYIPTQEAIYTVSQKLRERLSWSDSTTMHL